MCSCSASSMELGHEEMLFSEAKPVMFIFITMTVYVTVLYESYGNIKCTVLLLGQHHVTCISYHIIKCLSLTTAIMSLYMDFMCSAIPCMIFPHIDFTNTELDPSNQTL